MNKSVIKEQHSRLLGIITGLIGRDQPYAVVDFPNYANVGDSAIWLGQIKVLQESTGLNPRYVCNHDNFDMVQFLKAHPEGPIVITGGGNFGDIWLRHQNFREFLLTNFKDRLILQMPQSLKFNSPEKILSTAAIINAHPKFYLLVRDQQSFDFATTNFNCPVMLSPDAAFAIGPITRNEQPIHATFMLMRTDAESNPYDRKQLVVPDSLELDWLYEPPGYHESIKKIAALKALFTGAWSLQARRFVLYQELAKGRLARGLSLLQKGHLVITDRLHAHILSTLLNIPHVALDNSYGKVSGYIKSWTSNYKGVKTASTPAEAVYELQSLRT